MTSQLERGRHLVAELAEFLRQSGLEIRLRQSSPALRARAARLQVKRSESLENPTPGWTWFGTHMACSSADPVGATRGLVLCAPARSQMTEGT